MLKIGALVVEQVVVTVFTLENNQQKKDLFKMLSKHISLCFALILSALLSTSSARKLNIAQFDYLLKEKGKYLFVFFYSETQ